MKSLYPEHFPHLESLGRLSHLSAATINKCGSCRRSVMRFVSKRDEDLAALGEQLHCATVVTSGLLSDVIGIACARFDALGSAAKAKVKWLIEAGAFTDATIALLELELPQWKLQRLIYDEGKWHCSLSRQPEIPLRYDTVVEASHESLPLAILIALVQALRSIAAHAGFCAYQAPQTVPTTFYDPRTKLRVV
jgi:hypothetical protein